MNIKVKLSSNHCVLCGLVYSTEFAKAQDSFMSAIVSSVSKESEIASVVDEFDLVLPSTTGSIIETTCVKGIPKYIVKFENAKSSVAIRGKFLVKKV